MAYLSPRHAVCLVMIVAGIVSGPWRASAQQQRPGDVPTFTKDVAPILQRSCQNCHRPGSIGPMSLLTYEDARPWARSIKNARVAAPDAAVARRPRRRHDSQVQGRSVAAPTTRSRRSSRGSTAARRGAIPPTCRRRSSSTTPTAGTSASPISSSRCRSKQPSLPPAPDWWANLHRRRRSDRRPLHQGGRSQAGARGGRARRAPRGDASLVVAATINPMPAARWSSTRSARTATSSRMAPAS